jgi:hypothetical protein
VKFEENWPEKADGVDVAGGRLTVYDDAVMFESSAVGSPMEGQVFFDEDTILDLIQALQWAYGRMSSR